MLSTISDMRNHPMYEKFIAFAETKKLGQEIWKISIPSFEDFLERYETDNDFADKIDHLSRRKTRSSKINQIGS